MESIRKIAIAMGVVAICPAGVRAAWRLDSLGGATYPAYTAAYGINNAGAVVGFVIGGERGAWDPTLWINGTPRPVIGGSYYVAATVPSINDAGQIVGLISAYTPGSTVGWSAGYYANNDQVTFLQRKSGAQFWPNTVNNTGLMAGSLTVGGAATLDIATGAVTTFGKFGGLAAEFTAVNSAGLLAGTIVLGLHLTPTRAFVLDDGELTVLPDMGNDQMEPSAMNESGLILINGTGGKPYQWLDGTLSSLPLPNGVSAGCGNDVNDAGIIVGGISVAIKTDPFRESHAAMWVGDQVFDLNSFLPENSGWVLASATGINNLNQIVGNGYYHNQPAAFLLTPDTLANLPEPSLALLLACLALSPRRRCLRASA